MFEPSTFQLNIVQTGSEFEHYAAIEQLATFISDKEHAMGAALSVNVHADTLVLSVARAQHAATLADLTRFGITATAVDGALTDQYKEWWRRWNAYVKGLPEEEFRLLMQIVDVKQAAVLRLAAYHPE